MKRTCGTCTKCCEGFLAGEAHGHKFMPSIPCFFKSKNGCSIYENRPHDPCKTYECEWLRSENVPFWMKPDEINAIITTRKTDTGILYLDVIEAGEKLKVEVLNWLIIDCVSNKINIQYEISGAKHRFGSVEFNKCFK